MKWECFYSNFPYNSVQKPIGHNRTGVGHPGEMRPVEIHCFGPGGQHWSVSPRYKVFLMFITETVDPRGNRHNLKLFESTAIPANPKSPGERRNQILHSTQTQHSSKYGSYRRSRVSLWILIDILRISSNTQFGDVSSSWPISQKVLCVH